MGPAALPIPHPVSLAVTSSRTLQSERPRRWGYGGIWWTRNKPPSQSSAPFIASFVPWVLAVRTLSSPIAERLSPGLAGGWLYFAESLFCTKELISELNLDPFSLSFSSLVTGNDYWMRATWWWKGAKVFASLSELFEQGRPTEFSGENKKISNSVFIFWFLV